MSDQHKQARKVLLAQATDRIATSGSTADVLRYLHAYYRRVDFQDLEVAGPWRLGETASEHANLAAHRPHGRALVKVRSGTDATLLRGRDVIDVVTDDMPFLIDTITMTLAGHEVTAELVVHPQLLVRRDVTGSLREVLGSIEGPRSLERPQTAESELAPDELAESWSHIEVAKLPAGKGEAIAAALERALGDVRMAVEDYHKMRAMALRLADIVASGPQTEPERIDSPAEISELLRWLVDAHFTFLGFREYDLVHSEGGLALRGVPGTGLGILRHDKPGTTSFAELSPRARESALDAGQRLILSKANSRATVHRPSYLDYLGVKRLTRDGEVDGEYRFLGLYTHAAYSESVTRIPVLRRKLAEVLATTRMPAESHDGRDITEFMEVYPREELFQTTVDELVDVATAVLRLRVRMQTRLFLRKDSYGKYASCLIYLSRDRYNTKARLAVEDILRRELGGSQLDFSAVVDETPIARLHIVVRADRDKELADPDVADLEQKIAAAVRSWDDDLAAEAISQLGEDLGRELLAEFADCICDTYKADVPAAAAVSDLAKIRQMRANGQDIWFELWESEGYVGGVPLHDDTPAPPVNTATYTVVKAVTAGQVSGSRTAGTSTARSTAEADDDDGTRRVWRLTIHRTGAPITLTDVLPRLQHMGVEVVDEHPYHFPAADPFWIYDFGLRREGANGRPGPKGPTSIASVADQLQGALAALWRDEIDDDVFNALVIDAGLSWRQVIVLRAYAKYLRQVGTTFSQGYIAQVLRSNPVVSRRLIRLFESRFDPARQVGERERSEALVEEIRGELDDVASLDQDRILRAYLGLILATVRTNYFQGRVKMPADAGWPGRGSRPADAGGAGRGSMRADAGGAGRGGTAPPYLVFKLDAGAVPDLPAPRPRFELFVYSPRFEGVHLRFASVARGGLRWSDRREDFRTEILGLAKAQEVKNSVIVPSGAKGGFVCKQLPGPSQREAHQAEVLACYRMFISAMLDVTDNLQAGQPVPPDRVVRHDGDDPYLVVAADKGTASFSDTANEIAQRRGFWLGDAFASGGSAGYDHKKMGITARGAWESVKFHFQTLGIDVDKTDFTVAGVGDMSGDVFGNGMLLSRHIKLIAAFDHRHVFIDPDPDPAVSFDERQRLFGLPRSSWADYDQTLISAGGGVWPRTAKSVPVSRQARSALGIAEQVTALPVDDMISAILAAPVDLLWNGGIGTYIKATSQAQADVGDRSNDGVRINASQVRAKVIGEGGNLGVTQAGRIEYALAGGLIDTDFIDNSAGVDTSDHEVNIKILLDEVVRDGELTKAQRDALLHEMTDDVARLVLAHNYYQNRALAAARAQAAQMLHVHARYIRKLERDGRIRRRLDVLPGERELAERRSASTGLTVPEFCVLLAQTKIGVAQEVLASGLPGDPYLRNVLTSYFPAELTGRYANRMPRHRLHREIITTVVVNDMVDRSGITFVFRLNEETGASTPDITAAWLVAREVFDMAGFSRQLKDLDGQVETAAQILALLEARKLTERAVRWLLHFRRPPFDIQSTIDYFAGGVLTVAGGLPKLLAGLDLSSFEERRDSFTARGFPGPMADRIAAMVPAYSAFDIVEIASMTGRDVEETAEVYFDLAERLQITRLRDRITALPRDDRWNTMARGALRDDLYTAHAALAMQVLTVTGPGSPEERLAAWVARNASAVARSTQTLAEIWESDAFTVATLSVAVRAIRTLVSASTLPV